MSSEISRFCARSGPPISGKTQRLPLFVMVAVLLTPLALFVPQYAAAQHRTQSEQSGNNLLDPLEIPKFVEPLVIPPVMPPTGTGEDGAVEYRIAVRQFEQQILPAGFPSTTLFGYGRAGDPLPGSAESSTFNFPAFTIETRSSELVRVEWINQLVDDPDSEAPQFLPHLLPVDQTVHWANPNNPDSRSEDSRPYDGPVPIVTHVHGGHTPAVSDGYPEAWYLPSAANLPEDMATHGTFYGTAQPATAGSAIFEYPQSQRSATLWYHDHTLGMTRLNVYAGMAGFWLLRDDLEAALNLPGPAPRLGDAAGTPYYEIPIAIQDRSFYEDGSLFYPDNRAFFDEFEGPYFPQGVVPPIWNPEFFGNSMVVNGKTWPYLEVEPRLYRLRFLNGTNARFLILKFDADLPFHVIGIDGGFLPGAPIELARLLMAPAERLDIIVDFSDLEPGDEVVLLNLGPDAPFGGLPIEREDMANPDTTGQVMQFRVVPLTTDGNAGEIPTSLPSIDQLDTALPERFLTLSEEMSSENEDGVPVAALLGTTRDGPLGWSDPITENPAVGTTEVWNIVNMTGDAHPIHPHELSFQLIERVPFDVHAYHEAQEAYLLGRRAGDPPDPLDFATEAPRPREAWENGWKDTVIAYPGEVTRIIMTFKLEGLYVWHCHILEHEDNEMMRPYYIGEIPEGLFTELMSH